MEILGDILLTIACALGVGYVWYYFKKAGARRRLLDERPQLQLDAIYKEYFMDTGVIKEFIKLWEELSSILDVPPGKLLPSDRFDIELAPTKGYEFNDQIRDVRNKILDYAVKTKVDSQKIRRVRDYVVEFGSR